MQKYNCLKSMFCVLDRMYGKSFIFDVTGGSDASATLSPYVVLYIYSKIYHRCQYNKQIYYLLTIYIVPYTDMIDRMSFCSTLTCLTRLRLFYVSSPGQLAFLKFDVSTSDFIIEGPKSVILWYMCLVVNLN